MCKIQLGSRVMSEVPKTTYHVVNAQDLIDILTMHFHGPRQTDLEAKIEKINLAKDKDGFIKLELIQGTDYKISYWNKHDQK